VSLLAVAYTLFLLNFAFGIAVKLKIVDSSRFRYVHHGLFALVIISLLAAILADVVSTGSIPWPLAGLVIMLLLIARFPGSTAPHPLYATICLIVYTLAVIL
jgi:hypothetical protein